MTSLAVGREGSGELFSYDDYPRLEELAAVTPNSTTFYAIMHASPSDVRDSVFRPAGDDVEERLSNFNLGAVVESVTWSNAEAT